MYLKFPSAFWSEQLEIVKEEISWRRGKSLLEVRLLHNGTERNKKKILKNKYLETVPCLNESNLTLNVKLSSVELEKTDWYKN